MAPAVKPAGAFAGCAIELICPDFPGAESSGNVGTVSDRMAAYEWAEFVAATLLGHLVIGDWKRF